jgi:hypothetical protein
MELTDSERELFHTVIAQGLFLCKLTHCDIAPAIAVQHPARDDWMKLVK